jgi:hypothetical protein
MQFRQSVLGDSSAAPSMDESDGQPMPDPDESNTVITGNGFQAVDSKEPSESVSWDELSISRNNVQ